MNKIQAQSKDGKVYFSVPASYEVENHQENSEMVKCKLYVMHEGINYNGSSFSYDGIENAKGTLKNIPILAFVKTIDGTDEKDFGDHEVETRVQQGADGQLKVKEYFLERPIGVIPESNNYRYEEIDGIKYVVVDGYIWKCYANEAFDILDEAKEKKVSMEIKIIKGEKHKVTGIYEVDEYEYLGVTILGDDIPPAMGENCTISMYSQENNKTIEYFKMVEDFNSKLKKNSTEVDMVKIVKEGQADGTVETKENFSATEPKAPVVENQTEPTPVVENEQPLNEEGKKLNFNLSIGNLEGAIREELSKRTIKIKEWYDDEEREVKEFSLRDVVIDESIAIVRDYDWTKHIGIPYELKGDTVVLKYEAMQDYIQVWKVKEGVEPTPIVTYGKKELVSEIESAVKEKFAKMEEEKQVLVTENEELKKFKTEVETKEVETKVDETIAKFSFSAEEVEALKVKAYSKELSIEGLEKELFALEGMKAFNARQKFSSKEVEQDTTTLKIPTGKIDDVSQPYGSVSHLFD